MTKLSLLFTKFIHLPSNGNKGRYFNKLLDHANQIIWILTFFFLKSSLFIQTVILSLLGTSRTAENKVQSDPDREKTQQALCFHNKKQTQGCTSKFHDGGTYTVKTSSTLLLQAKIHLQIIYTHTRIRFKKSRSPPLRQVRNILMTRLLSSAGLCGR